MNKEYFQKYREKNRDRIRKHNKKHYELHSEELRAKRRQIYLEKKFRSEIKKFILSPKEIDMILYDDGILRFAQRYCLTVLDPSIQKKSKYVYEGYYKTFENNWYIYREQVKELKNLKFQNQKVIEMYQNDFNIMVEYQEEREEEFIC